jgi:hypothetical protein
MLRCSVFCPEGAEQKSPEQRPGKPYFRRKPSPERAQHGRRDVSPLQGSEPHLPRFLGRCPRLICRCPFGATENLARSLSAHSVRPVKQTPYDLAFLALAQERLGQSEKALGTLRRLSEMIRNRSGPQIRNRKPCCTRPRRSNSIRSSRPSRSNIDRRPTASRSSHDRRKVRDDFPGCPAPTPKPRMTTVPFDAWRIVFRLSVLGDQTHVLSSR